MTDTLIRWGRASATGFERLLALIILASSVAFGAAGVLACSGMDWSESETYYEVVYRVLLLVIGIELARTLLTHDLKAILELLAFVVARKTLKPEISAVEILVCIVAFVALLASKVYLLDRRPHGGAAESAAAPPAQPPP